MDTNERQAKQLKKSKSTELIKIALAGMLVIAMCGVSFWVGVSYQKKQQPVGFNYSGSRSISGNVPNDGFGNGMGGTRARGGIGSVTAISSNSMTVKSERSDSSTTYSLTSSTAVINNDTNLSISDIKVGDTVMVQTSSSDNKTATKIIINPTMPGGGPNMQQGSSSSSSNDYDNSAL